LKGLDCRPHPDRGWLCWVAIENAASSVSVNVSDTSCGATLRAESADGLECEREAWAAATGTLRISKSHDKAAANDLMGTISVAKRAVATMS
jgi:hypothetical protein